MIEWLLTAGAGAGAITAVGFVLARTFKSVRRFFRLLDLLDRRTKQLENNGGGSMKDVIEAMQSDLAEFKSEVSGRFDTIERRQRRRFWE